MSFSPGCSYYREGDGEANTQVCPHKRGRLCKEPRIEKEPIDKHMALVEWYMTVDVSEKQIE